MKCEPVRDYLETVVREWLPANSTAAHAKAASAGEAERRWQEVG
jgi:hypothetical protein